MPNDPYINRLVGFKIRVLSDHAKAAFVSLMRGPQRLLQCAFNTEAPIDWRADPDMPLCWANGGQLTLHSTSPIVFADIWINGVLLKIRVSDDDVALAKEEEASNAYPK